MEILREISKMYGFESASHFFKTLFGHSDKFLTVCIAILAALPAIIEQNIYESYQAIYFLGSLYLIDFLTGLWKAFKNKTLCSKSFPRATIMFFIACLMLFIAFNAGKHSMIFSLLPSTLYGIFIGQQIISIFENLYELGYVNSEIIDFIRKKFSIKSILKKEGKE